MRWAHRVLATWNIGKADRVLVSTPNFEGPWSSPLVKALRELEAPHSNAEPYGWDVRRSATFLRLLRFKAFIAVSGEVATGLLRAGWLPVLVDVRPQQVLGAEVRACRVPEHQEFV